MPADSGQIGRKNNFLHGRVEQHKGGISPAAYDRPAFPLAPSEAYATIERSDMSTEVTVRLSRAIAMRSRASACPVSFKSVSVDPLTLITSSTNLPGVRFTSIARQETGMAKKAAKTIFFVTTFIFRDIQWDTGQAKILTAIQNQFTTNIFVTLEYDSALGPFVART